jgi:hypothetical protein
MASRVVPGMSNAITRSSPISVLTSVDLPTFGRPTMAILTPRAGRHLLGQFRTLLNGQVQRLVDQFAHAVAVRRRDRVRVAHAQFVEIRRHRGVLHALGLVDRQHDAAPCLAQVVGDDAVLRRQAQAAIDEEDDDIRFHHGLARLLGHFGHDAVLGHRLEAAGIDHDERTIADTALAVVAVARQARQIGDERVARAGHAIE